MTTRIHKSKSLLIGTVLGATLWTSLSTTRSALAAPVAAPAPALLSTATLTNPPALGNGINLGGFSALTHLPDDPKNVFYTITDRGPNGSVTVNGVSQTAFPLPKFTPTILKIERVGNSITILQQIPLKLAQGTDPITGTQYISGIPNLAGRDEAPFDPNGNPLPYDPYGLDTEGIAYNPETDTFWLSEEYRPSLVEVARDGTILRRLIPQGEASFFTNASNIPVSDTLPAVLAKRVQNRGLESVTITPNGRYLYTAIQSPLANPNSASTAGARVLRIEKLDLHNLHTVQVVSEFAYLTPLAPLGINQSSIFISDMFALNTDTLLVDERDNKKSLKNIVLINVKETANTLNFGTFQDKTLEQMTVAELQLAGIVFPTAKVVLDLLDFGYPFAKVEGLAFVGNKLSVVNDKDFQIGSTDVTQLWTFKIPNALLLLK